MGPIWPFGTTGVLDNKCPVNACNWRARVLYHGGGWLVNMQHFCLHDCAAFAIRHGLVIGGGIVALCTFCDTLTSPRGQLRWRTSLWFGIIMVVAKQAPTIHVCMHTYNCIAHWFILMWKGTAPRRSGSKRTVRTRLRRSSSGASTPVYPSRLVCQISYCGTCVCSSVGMW